MSARFERVLRVLRRLIEVIRLIPHLWRARRRSDLREAQRSYRRWVPLCVFSEPVRWIRMLLRSSSRYRVMDQRPPSFYVPHVTAVPFPEPDRVSRSLEEEFETIAAEFGEIAHQEATMPGSLSSSLVKSGSWNSFPLMRLTRTFDENIARCPKTWAAVQRCPLADPLIGDVYFSIMDPGTHVRPHYGPTNLRIRYHLAIEDDEGARIRSGHEWRTWRRGECLILDDSFEHEVRHDGDRRRVVLIVDCWHPDLTDPERRFLAEVCRLSGV